MFATDSMKPAHLRTSLLDRPARLSRMSPITYADYRFGIQRIYKHDLNLIRRLNGVDNILCSRAYPRTISVSSRDRRRSELADSMVNQSEV
jgi:hypothetical protein